MFPKRLCLHSQTMERNLADYDMIANGFIDSDDPTAQKASFDLAKQILEDRATPSHSYA